VLYETMRRLITALIDDATAETRRRLEGLAPISAGDVRHAGHPVVAFSPSMIKDLDGLRAFLAVRVYRHERIQRVMNDAERIVTDLFRRYREDPAALPPEWRAQAPEHGYLRYVCDFIAGMTDRYALGEHRRLFDATPELR
jgi:dGTPase